MESAFTNRSCPTELASPAGGRQLSGRGASGGRGRGSHPAGLGHRGGAAFASAGAIDQRGVEHRADFSSGLVVVLDREPDATFLPVAGRPHRRVRGRWIGRRLFPASPPRWEDRRHDWAVGCDRPRVHRPAGSRVGLSGSRNPEPPGPARLPTACATPGGGERRISVDRRLDVGDCRRWSSRVREGRQLVTGSLAPPAVRSASGLCSSEACWRVHAGRGAGAHMHCGGRRDGNDCSEFHQQVLRPVRPGHDQCGGQS